MIRGFGQKIRKSVANHGTPNVRRDRESMPTALVVMGAKGLLSIFISIRDFQRKALCHNREVFALATFECPYFASVPHHRYVRISNMVRPQRAHFTDCLI